MVYMRCASRLIKLSFDVTFERAEPSLNGAVQGLSEPFGALMALLSIRPFLTPMRLQYMLAFVGGVMVSIIA